MTTYLCTDNYLWLKSQPENSIDSIVTDSPYGLGKEPDPTAVLRDWLDHGYHEVVGKGFMGKKWDAFVPQPLLWKEAFRVLKPGGYLLSFFGTRTYDWGTMAIRLAGFEIRDQIGWIYGSGFPKSSNQHGDYEGWGTALKPAMEPICVARKPIIGTVSKNLEKFGVGAINIEACRIPLLGYKSKPNGRPSMTGLPDNYDRSKANQKDTVGRWPANLIHDGSDEVIEVFPYSKGQSGSVSGHEKSRTGDENTTCYGEYGRVPFEKRGDSGSASRFFYCAKPSPEERNRGLDGFKKVVGHSRWDKCGTCGGYIFQSDNRGSKCTCETPSRVDSVFEGNFHPTVKPIALMRYLIRLVTPPAGTCLDLFSGSGTTGIAAELEGINCICLDNEQDYIQIAQHRAEAWRPKAPPPHTQLDLQF